MTEIGIGLLGFGTVGAGVVEGLRRHGDLIAKRTGIQLVIKKIADLDIESEWCAEGSGISILQDWNDWGNLVDSTDSPDVFMDRREHPYESCVTRGEQLVFDSWDAKKAALYRRELHIADEWGTGVIVQRMVFGNLDRHSGTGVVLTSDPDFGWEAVELNGDFVIQGQGEDVVSGLVETFPISERQRRSESRSSSLSLETGYPEIYSSLTGISRSLVSQHGMNQQEIEFTFDGDRSSDLYILQTFEHVSAFDKYSRCSGATRSNHDRGGCRKSEGAGTGDYED